MLIASVSSPRFTAVNATLPASEATRRPTSAVTCSLTSSKLTTPAAVASAKAEALKTALYGRGRRRAAWTAAVRTAQSIAGPTPSAKPVASSPIPDTLIEPRP